MLTFNFSTYYLNPELSDVAIKITTGGAVKAELPGHGIVLANVSKLFKEQIDEASVVLLDVEQDPLQATGARALVQYVYQGILPDTEHQALLVHVLHLAHKFAVYSCKTACLEALMAVDEQGLQLDAIHVVFSLLSEAADQGFAALIQHCLRRLQRQLGDLEATLSDQELLGCLQHLPHTALLALLSDEHTSAASENTVLAAVQSWLGAQPADSPVTFRQRQQLASAIRIPFLEPMYMATVLPRIPWLLDILGPAGLAMAAGAARGMCDPHAEPCLSNSRACGGLAAAWLKGTRPIPASCTSAEQDGPQISIQWSLAISQVKQVFDAACAAAATAAAARRKAEIDAAAARLQDAAAPGPQSWTASSAAVAVSAAAAAAVNFGASMFRKRKRIADQQEDDSVAASQGGSQLVAAAEGAAAVDEEAPCSSRRRRRGAKRTAAVYFDTPEPATAATKQIGITRTVPTDDLEDVDATAPAELQSAQQQQQQLVWPALPQPLKACSSEVQFAGYTWRLVLYFQQAGKQPSSQHAAAGVTIFSADGSGGQQARAATIAVATGAHSQQNQQTQPHLITFKTVGATDYLGLLQTPGGSKRARRAGSAAVGTEGGLPRQQLHRPGVGLWGRREGSALHAVAEAAAMGLPDDSVGSAVHTGAPAATAGAIAGCRGMATTASASISASDVEVSGLVWHAKLAIEAWPCIALQPGVSTAAFSGNLAVQLGSSSGDGNAARAVGHREKQGPGRSAADGIGRNSGQHRSQPYQRIGAIAALKGRQLAGQQQPAAVATAAAVARPPRSSSMAIGEAGAVGHARAIHSKRAAALVAAAKMAAGSDTVPESDDAGDCSDEHDDVQLVEHSEDQESDQHEVHDEAEYELQEPVVGASDRGCSRSVAAAAAAGQGSDRHEYGSMPVGYARDVTRQHSTQALRLPGSIVQDVLTAAASDDVQEEEAEDEEIAAAAVGAFAPASGAASAGRCNSSGGSWVVFQLPQGSWVKSRRCDTGFRDFFGVQMQQGQWHEAAWSRYLQPEGMLNLKGTIWNVR